MYGAGVEDDDEELQALDDSPYPGAAGADDDELLSPYPGGKMPRFSSRFHGDATAEEANRAPTRN